MKKIKRERFTCKCGCGESRIREGHELTAKFINAKHYGHWMKTNHNLWGTKKKETDKWTEPKNETTYTTTGSFPMFI